jgi:hypothetical protein
MTVGVFLMQKDEFELFPLFVKYYGSLVGYGNIFVVDNGSSEKMLPLLSDAISLGVHVDFTHTSKECFENKGRILEEKMKLLADEYEICIPLDCDEFIGLETTPGVFTFDKDTITRYLESLHKGIFKLKAGNRFRNSITDYTKFYRFYGPTKVFSKSYTLNNLSLGFHVCSNYRNASNCSLCYFELHNKPFNLFNRHSISKMKNRVNLGHTDKIRKYKGAGNHLVKYLGEKGKELYYKDLNSKAYITVSGLENSFSRLGIKVPESLMEDKRKLISYGKSVI